MLFVVCYVLHICKLRAYLYQHCKTQHPTSTYILDDSSPRTENIVLCVMYYIYVDTDISYQHYKTHNNHNTTPYIVL